MTNNFSEKQKEEYARRFGRWINDDEIVFDADDREKGWEAINFIGINLYNEGYNFRIEYAEGQKGPHLIVPEIHGLEELTPEQLSRYKEMFIRKFTPHEYHVFMDFKMCSKHRVAELWKLHHKYGTIKKVIAKFNDHCDNIEDYDLLEKCRNEGIGESDRKIIRNKNGITAKIVAKVSIIGVARRYGIDVRKNKAVCPFHADRNPSLSFDDTNGLFYCFGCCNGGNIIDFLSKCKEQGLKKIEIKNG